MSFKATLFEVCNQLEYISVSEIEQAISELAKQDNITEIAYSIHDRDILDDGTPKPVHFHCMVRTQKVTTSKNIAKYFKHNGKSISDNYVQRSKFGSYCKMVQYLTHKNDLTKAQYDYETEVFKVKGDIDTYYKTDLDIITKPRYPYYAVDWTFVNKSYSQQYLEIDAMDFGNSQVGQTNKIKCFNQLEKLYNAHIKGIQLKGVDREMNVIYITGESGTGKTTIAKFLAKALGYDICVSSSGNDPMQDYVGQKCLILDEFRQSDWQLSDLLKLLDNHTTSTIKSRYNNKYMNDCKLIILTSVFPITDTSYQKYNNEPLKQLYRRINSYVVVSEDTYITYEKLNEYGTPTGKSFTTPNPAKELGQEGTNILFEAIAQIAQKKIQEGQEPQQLEMSNLDKK